MMRIEHARTERVEGFANDFHIGGPVVDPASSPRVSGLASDEQPCIGQHFEVQPNSVASHVEGVHQLLRRHFAVGDDDP